MIRPFADRDARRARAGKRRGLRGFTLIELLIAATLLAVLALLSWRGLDTVLTSRDRIAKASDELRFLTIAFAQMDEDLRKSWPVRLLKLPVPSIAFSVSGEQASTTLELLRESTGALEPTKIQRVAWRLRGDVLERGFGPLVVSSASPATKPVGGDAEAAAGGLVWQPVLGGVSSLRMQGWVQGQGWVVAEALAGQLKAAASAAAAPPAGAPGGGAASGAPPAAGAAPPPAAVPAPAPVAMVTGLQVVVVRSDGKVLERVFPVKD
jgi:general secretion pathway protein J